MNEETKTRIDGNFEFFYAGANITLSFIAIFVCVSALLRNVFGMIFGTFMLLALLCVVVIVKLIQHNKNPKVKSS